jgi:hypothetical protein
MFEMWVAIFSLGCGVIAASGVIGLYIQMDTLVSEVSRLTVYVEEMRRKVATLERELTVRSDLSKLQEVINGRRGL